MMNDNLLKPELLCGLFGDSFQLVFGHLTMRLVIESLNFSIIFDGSDQPPKIDKRSDAGDVASFLRKRCPCH